MLTPSPVFRRAVLIRGRRGLGQSDICIDNGDGTQNCFPAGGTDTSPVGGLPCQSDDSGGLVAGQVYCSSGGLVPASAGANLPSLNSPSAQGGAKNTGFSWTPIIQTAILATQKGVQAAQSNPLTHLQPGFYYQSSPQGGTIVSTAGQPLGTSALTTTTLGNLLPILLVGGVLVLFMVGRR